MLCGGQGSRLGEIAAMRPKPMLDIGEKPMLLHIMGWYARFGFRRFVLCTGHRSEVISDYFANFAALNSDFTVDLADRRISYHQPDRLPAWQVTVAFTGGGAMTGARLARAAARHLGEAEHFGVTYGDGLTDADLGDEFRFHLAHDRLGTVLGVHPPSQFGRHGAARGRQRQLRREAPPDRGNGQWRTAVIHTAAHQQRYLLPPSFVATPQRVRSLVFPLYAPGTPLEVVRLDPGETLAFCTRSGGWYESSPERVRELADWIGTTPAYAMSYGDGADAVTAVRRLLGL